MKGTLFVVATPIGNLADASERSIETLRAASVIACEDTRVSRTLFARFGIAAESVALHEHNEREAAARLLERLARGEHVALVSDAGTPGVSDPGALLVAQAHARGIRVAPIPGPSAVSAAVSASGFPAAAYHFAGFLPASPAARRKALEWLDLPVPLVLFEAPHRIDKMLSDLLERFGGEREIVLAREVTKKFEEIARMPLAACAAWLAGAAHRQQGEFVVVVAPGPERLPAPALDATKVLNVLLEVLAPSEAARIAARITGESKNALYKRALEGRPRRHK